MKKVFILTVLAEILFFSALGQNPPKDKNWEVIFQDDFTTLNKGRWCVNYGPHNGGSGSDEGVAFCTYEDVFVDNGELVLRTQKRNYPCSSNNCRYPNKMHPYTSGAINSWARYKYGYYEIRAKLPVSRGFAPTFWFLG